MDKPAAAAAPEAPRSRPLRRAAVAARNYRESLMDDLLSDHLGPLQRKRHRTLKEREKETEREAMLAISLGFPIDALLESELRSGVVSGAAEHNDYIVVRNHILARWRAAVHSWLSKEQIRETVSHDYDGIISSAHDFLSEHGYINFGVSPAVRSRFPADPDQGSVIVVGSGLAGLAAARQLLRFGFKVLVLEGRDRPGGRVYTRKIGGDGCFAAVDLGGSAITGIDANPLGVMARQLRIPLHKIRDRCPLFLPDGRDVDPRLDAQADLVFNKLLENAAKLRELLGEVIDGVSLGDGIERLRKLYNVASSGEERELLNWHLANLEYANAGCLSELSLLHWDQDDPYEMGGDHCFLAGGNWKLINALAEDVSVLYRKKVMRIGYGDLGVEVVVEGGQVFRADMALCTVPLGVLKSGNIVFDPELPAQKLGAIQRLGFGLLNKVAMIFPYTFWGEDLDTFGHLNTETKNRGEFFLFYGYHTVSGGPLLVALVAGEAALKFESSDPVVLLHRVLTILRDIYGARGIEVPDPIQTVCTKWGNDPFCFGSYSHVRVGSSGRDYDILADNLSGRLFFAGEATNRQYPATMHGAFLSGLREASCILHASRNRANMSSNIKNTPQKNPKLSSILVDLFKEPDLRFTNFSFVFDHFASKDPNAMGLMRVAFLRPRTATSVRDTFKEESERYGQSTVSHPEDLYLYAMLSQEQAQQIQLISGDDKSKLSLACKKLNLRLMGATSACDVGSSLINSIYCARRGRNSHNWMLRHQVWS